MFFAVTIWYYLALKLSLAGPSLRRLKSIGWMTSRPLGSAGEAGEYIPLGQPYEIVRLRFLPPGKDTPVTAVDKVDRGSVPNLQKGQIERSFMMRGTRASQGFGKARASLPNKPAHKCFWLAYSCVAW